MMSHYRWGKLYGDKQKILNENEQIYINDEITSTTYELLKYVSKSKINGYQWFSRLSNYLQKQYY